jgi:hypothetical protein
VPGLYVNLEVGASFSPNSRTHIKQVEHVTKRMEENLYGERIQHQHERGVYRLESATYRNEETVDEAQRQEALLPGNGFTARKTIYGQELERLSTRPRESREYGYREHSRGKSAPPSLEDRYESPVSPLSAISTESRSEFNFIPPLQFSRSMALHRSDPRNPRNTPAERTNYPLPPTPGDFRLGGENLPWSMPALFGPVPTEFSAPTTTRDSNTRRSDRDGRMDDPQRARDLETLQQAMMTVDSLGQDAWESHTSNSSVGENHKPSLSLGWAVSSTPREPVNSIGWAVSSQDSEQLLAPRALPPPYVVSQWEHSISRITRPRSAL